MLKLGKMIGILTHIFQRYLMRAPGVGNRIAINHVRASPALRRPQHNHWPVLTHGFTTVTRLCLQCTDFSQAFIHSSSHNAVHMLRIRTFDKMGLPAIAFKQRGQLGIRYARQQGRVVDFVAVEMKDGQNSTIAYGVEEFSGVPGGCQRTGLGLAIPNGYRDDQIRVIKGSTKGMRQAIAQLAAFMNGAWQLRRAVTADTARKGKLPEQLQHANCILADLRVHLRIGSFQIHWPDHPRGTMTRPRHENRLNPVIADQPVHVQIHKGQARA